MENIDFSIDSRGRYKLSKKAKVLYLGVGVFFILIGLIGLLKYLKLSETVLLPVSIDVYGGILFIIWGMVGYDFMTSRKFISFTNDSLTLKRSDKDEIQLPVNAIEQIAIKPSVISIKTKDNTIFFDLSWISYIDLQQLKPRISEFCNQHHIDAR